MSWLTIALGWACVIHVKLPLPVFTVKRPKRHPVRRVTWRRTSSDVACQGVPAPQLRKVAVRTSGFTLREGG
jgi:hypothetical protein